MVTFLSKYFSSAKENKKVKKLKSILKVLKWRGKISNIFLFDFKPSLSISFRIDFFTSKKMNTNNDKVIKYLQLINIVNYFGLIQ